MPRIAAFKKQYMVADLPGWIVGKIHTQGKKRADLAAALGITPQAFSARLKPDRRGKPKDIFSYSDLLTLFDELDATDEEILRLMRVKKG